MCVSTRTLNRESARVPNGKRDFRWLSERSETGLEKGLGRDARDE